MKGTLVVTALAAAVATVTASDAGAVLAHRSLDRAIAGGKEPV